MFLGIENMLDEDLAFLQGRARRTREREGGRRVGNATHARDRRASIAHGMYVVGGIIVGNPDDTRESIEANLAFARRYVDWPYIQHPTPYPGTPMTTDFRRARPDRQRPRRGIRRHDRGRADRAPRGRGDRVHALARRAMDEAAAHAGVAAPLSRFVLRHAPRMLAHTFRGSSWRSMLGLESAREVFRRYRRSVAASASICRWPIPSRPRRRRRRETPMMALALVFGIAGHLVFTAPAAWQSRPPASSMRVAEFVVPRTAGDAEDADVIIYYFGGQGGSAEANITRWIGQMQQPDGRPSAEVARRESRTVNAMKVSLVDVSGTVRR